MGLGKWLKSKLGAIAFATASVEKNALGQDGGADLGNASGQYNRHRQGSLADDLKQGNLTQEVKDLRWRMYKVAEEADKYKSVVMGYDEHGNRIMETTKIDQSEFNQSILSKIKTDDADDYSLELVVNNDEITLGGLADMDIDISVLDQKDINDSKVEDEEGNWSASIGVVDGEAYGSGNKAESVIRCIRESRVKFEIEKFTKKMNVRTISDTEKLLEFYISIYPDEYNRKSKAFINEVKKTMKNPRIGDFLDIVGVEFISYNTVGVKDLHEFEYKITGFDKLIEFDGYYVVKFKSEVIKNGESTYEKFKEEGLEERYKNKEKK